MAFWFGWHRGARRWEGGASLLFSLIQRMRVPIALPTPAQIPTYLTHVKPSKPPKTSAPTPPRSIHIPTIFPSTSLLTPPFFAFHTPSSPPAPAPPVSASAALEESRDGGSIVRTASNLNSSAPFSEEAMVTATTASATASSAWEGSKKMLVPTLMTNNVIGGLAPVAFELGFEVRVGVFVVEGGYNGTAASQSSLNSGSSSFSKPFTGAGRCVDRRARCVVRERRGRG